MATGNLAVSIKGVGKSYRIAHNQVSHFTLAEAIIHRIKHPRGNVSRETFWALRDVSFEVNDGEVVGIVGRNGAGKSTLLKVLSRITPPSEGEVKLYGHVGSLLEVGTGFHPELTGRENIFLNGAILGMRRSEIEKQFDAIVDFAGVEKFIDTPCKRYSSGMYVRLAFAVAAHLRSEIMIVDEVLAVGDAEFQKKCLGKMHDVASSGRTVLFVSHNMQAVRLLCTRGVVLRRGGVAFDGDVQGAVNAYLASFAAEEIADINPDLRPGSGEFRFSRVWCEKGVYGPADEKVIRFTLKHKKNQIGRMFIRAHIFDEMGFEVVRCDGRLTGGWFEDGEQIEGSLIIRTPWLKPGDYRVEFMLGSAGVIDRFENATFIHVSPVVPYPYSAPENEAIGGVTFADFEWDASTMVDDNEGRAIAV